MQRLRETVQLQHIAHARRLAEHVERRNRPVEHVVRAQQAFIADRPHMRQTEDGLKHARERQLAVLHREAFQAGRHFDVETVARAGRPFLLRNRHAILSRESRAGRTRVRTTHGAIAPKCASSIWLKQAPCARSRT